MLDSRQARQQPWIMKLFRMALGLGLLPLLFLNLSATGSQATNPPPQITFELRDGSRLIGHLQDDSIGFRSALLGQFKLAVKDIRSVECVSSNTAKLVTANGDYLTVEFSDSPFELKTSFGTVRVAGNSLRMLTVASPGAGGAHLPGLVALWSGEDNGRDSVGGHDAELTDIDFAEGKVGRAFALNGYSSWAVIPVDKAPQLTNAEGLTIAAWIKPSNVQSFHPILEWEVTKQKDSVQLWLGHLPQDYGLLAGNIGDIYQENHQIISPPGIIQPGRFQHVALTYDKTSGVCRLYVNGHVVAERNFGSVTPDTTGPIFISRRPCDEPGDWTYDKYFSGLLDEISIYDRALSPEDIRSICVKDNHGDLPPTPHVSLPINVPAQGFRN